MALPLLAIAAALAAGSAVANKKGQDKISGARKDALQLFREKTEGLREKARVASDSTNKLYTDIPDAADDAGAEAEARLSAVLERAIPTASGSPIADSTSARVVGEVGRKGQQERVQTKSLGAQLAKLMGSDTAMKTAETGVRQNAIDLRNYGSFAGGYKNALDVGLSVAPAMGAGYQQLGDVLSMFSQLAMMGGLNAPGPNAPGGSAWMKGAAEGPAPYGFRGP